MLFKNSGKTYNLPSFIKYCWFSLTKSFPLAFSLTPLPLRILSFGDWKITLMQLEPVNAFLLYASSHDSPPIFMFPYHLRSSVNLFSQRCLNLIWIFIYPLKAEKTGKRTHISRMFPASVWMSLIVQTQKLSDEAEKRSTCSQCAPLPRGFLETLRVLEEKWTKSALK